MEQNVTKKDLNNLSRLMTQILRHTAPKYSLEMDADGYVNLAHIFALKEFVKIRDRVDLVQEIVKNDNKSRFNLYENAENWYIRANQGHSIPGILCEMPVLDNAFRYPVIVHGTYYEGWKFIEKTGLNKMARNHIRCLLNRFFDWP